MKATEMTQSDSLLRRLPEVRCEQIVQWCDTPATEDRAGGFQYAREQLALEGIDIGIEALTDFYKWRRGRDVLCDAIEHADEMKELMMKFRPGDSRIAEDFGDFCFLVKAIREKDSKTYAAMRAVRQRDEALAAEVEQSERKAELDERRITTMEEKAAADREKQGGKKEKGGLSPEALKEIEEGAKLL